MKFQLKIFFDENSLLCDFHKLGSLNYFAGAFHCHYCLSQRALEEEMNLMH